MPHLEIEAQVDAYLDGELAATDAAQLEAHLAGCPDCTRFRSSRLALRSAITDQIPRFEAPEFLRQRLRSGIRDAVRPAPSRRPLALGAWRWLAMAASVAVVALGSWRLAVERTRATLLADQVLVSHVRSLMPGHLIDVPSSDRHTVKPWFNGKLDFSPPVYDFSGRDYPLLGGRLDYLNGRPVAALVYRRRQHLINVFLWPASGSKDGAAHSVQQGYHLLHWTTPEYAYWVASDLGLPELNDFVALLQLADSTAASTE